MINIKTKTETLPGEIGGAISRAKEMLKAEINQSKAGMLTG